ncbi:SDR family NAD(P)-dependent oxidoreductase [Pseudonocardia zijingensis]|jgi:NAD(P)-dependent dehydrogenase (short-subunit alcohol dehydrogenase family)|uniref:SDR family oxidoreductase n=1 Tax=Pseudonocardia zijingensis TaxID=153376 RepID=A0ABN1NYK9_9PSEU
MTIALVTGANKGIGREIAARLATLDATVLLAARDAGRREEAVSALQAAGGDVHPLALDVTDPASVTAAAVEVERRFGRLDVLVNNAGISGSQAAQVPGGTDIDVVRAVFETNVFGVIAVIEAFLPLLRRSTAARIVNMSSSVGSLARMSDPAHYFARMPGWLGYSPSKSALNQITVQYAKQLRPEGILVNAADPGPCVTDFTAGIPGVTRTAADGAAIAVQLATLPGDGPTGAYLAESGPVPW